MTRTRIQNRRRQACGGFQSVKKLAEFRRARRKNVDLFCPGACTSDKTLYVLLVWNLCAYGTQIMRAAGCKLFQTGNQQRVSRLRACQKHFLTRSSGLRKHPKAVFLFNVLRPRSCAARAPARTKLRRDFPAPLFPSRADSRSGSFLSCPRLRGKALRAA